MPRVTNLIALFKGGSTSAYCLLFDAYFPRLVSVAGRHLDRRLSGVTGAEDVALSAFLGLWQEVNDGRTLGDGLTDRESLLRALSLLVAQRARRAFRHATQCKRDVRRTLYGAEVSGRGPGGWEGLPDAGLDPSQQVLFRETLVEALAVLTPLQRSIVEQKLAGYTDPEITATVGRSLRTVERQLSEVRSLWVARGIVGVELPQ